MTCTYSSTRGAINFTSHSQAQRHTGHPLNSKVLWNNYNLLPQTIWCMYIKFTLLQACNIEFIDISINWTHYYLLVNLYMCSYSCMSLCVCGTLQGLHKNPLWWMQHSCFQIIYLSIYLFIYLSTEQVIAYLWCSKRLFIVHFRFMVTLFSIIPATLLQRSL